MKESLAQHIQLYEHKNVFEIIVFLYSAWVLKLSGMFKFIWRPMYLFLPLLSIAHDPSLYGRQMEGEHRLLLFCPFQRKCQGNDCLGFSSYLARLLSTDHVSDTDRKSHRPFYKLLHRFSDKRFHETLQTHGEEKWKTNASNLNGSPGASMLGLSFRESRW